jgi:amino-acid N-acetyltransferase
MPSQRKPRVTVRAARPRDLRGVEEFIDPFVEAGRLLPRTTDELNSLLNTGFVAVVKGRIVGFAALEVYSKKLAELRSLAVAEDWQGQGIGRRLVEACVNLAKERRVFEVMTITSTDQFFRRCGFDFTLPGEKKALFLQTREDPA